MFGRLPLSGINFSPVFTLSRCRVCRIYPASVTATDLRSAMTLISRASVAVRCAEEWIGQLAGSAVRFAKRSTVRAALQGHVGNPVAWKLKALQDDIEDSSKTAVFLDRVQRKALIAAAEPAAGCFLRGMELTGARPIELSAATVAECGMLYLATMVFNSSSSIVRTGHLAPTSHYPLTKGKSVMTCPF